MVAVVHDCAKFKYECGNYTDASEYLYFYRVLVRIFFSRIKIIASCIVIHVVSIPCFQAPPGHTSLMSAGWGRLSSAILVQDWDTALEELNKLRRDIDESVSCNFCTMLRSFYQN